MRTCGSQSFIYFGCVLYWVWFRMIFQMNRWGRSREKWRPERNQWNYMARGRQRGVQELWTKLSCIDSISVLLSFSLGIPAFVGSYTFHSKSFIFNHSEIHRSCTSGNPSTWVLHLYSNFLLQAKSTFFCYRHSLPQT